MPAPVLEIACFNSESAVIAEAAGANRVELCEDYSCGGVTPSEEMITQVRRLVKLPLMVMIRPRAGDFVYSETEIAQMEESILFCRSNGVNGVVFGTLTGDNQIDRLLCSRLTNLARPMSVTFHRAIDECNDIKHSVRELVSIGVDRVLTSGRGKTALAGLSEISILQKIFGKQIAVMPGGGIRSSNITALFGSGCQEYHTSAITTGPNADAAEIEAVKQLLTQALAKG